ncbi:multidrug effflux MFS transporter [Endozoicomonas gorgoniicola]|uniref:Bcr/CflA family efflux transporter n=1 Tax=Endozoicomonas gorgoniicola TaxID=1234144 RepID=A0ABT3N2C0_9GAMM|nr:multidrug effflux MFS transporter [Endozoicomonas gorgoniicola]MCW7555766.1 multidrug effflux MFS transporter [Endozoicomonas gorgoniicola]
MVEKPYRLLLVALLMFPQIVETIYSPVLPDIAAGFGVRVEEATQTLSVYFLAFAVGVFFWGYLSDRIGRRKAMLSGLIVYGCGALLALFTHRFEWLMLARVVSAFGAAVGSVVTQTILRDCYEGSELAAIFSLMGVGIALSPVIGLASGGFLADHFGYQGVFLVLCILAILLWLTSLKWLPETQSGQGVRVSSRAVGRRMVRDKRLWSSMTLVALFNLMVFSYYSLSPFLFESLGYGPTEFGYSGVVLAIGSVAGSLLNKRLLTRLSPDSLVLLAALLAVIGGAGVWCLQDTLMFLLPMVLVMVSFGISIPNIVSQALVDYRQVVGTAGAFFGLGYYLMLGVLLGIAGLVQSIGLVLLVAGLISLILAWRSCKGFQKSSRGV